MPTWHDEDRGVRVLAGDVSEELHVVSVPLDAVQLTAAAVEVEAAAELHGGPRLHQAGQRVLVQGHALGHCTAGVEVNIRVPQSPMFQIQKAAITALRIYQTSFKAIIILLQTHCQGRQLAQQCTNFRRRQLVLTLVKVP